MWSHLNLWGSILVDFMLIHGDVILRMGRLLVSVRIITLSKFVFVEDVNIQNYISLHLLAVWVAGP